MREIGIAMQIFEIAASSIPKDLIGTPVKYVNLSVGKFSDVIPYLLNFYFEIASKDTAFEGAELKIEEIPVRALCRKCHHEFTIDNTKSSCPKCEADDLEILSGREFHITSIELAETS